MQITSKITKLQLKHPFKISRRETDPFRKTIFVEIDEGIGEASPAKFYGETVETVETALGFISSELNEDLDQIHEVMSKIESVLEGNYAAKSAIDMALNDRLS
ncbi:hypothetical protein F4083_06485, partial [Candidatus Poribacteria bacterium]|nr:hypothetical protein [Candidatus Poribacteria bacterium]